MSLHFLPTSTKAELEAAHMSKIAPPRPATIQEMEEAEMSAFYKAIVGRPVRVEIFLDTIMDARDRIRALRDACDRADAILSDHIQNPKPIHGRDKVLDWMVLSQVKSLFTSVRRLASNRLGSRQSRGEKSK
jgi:hypothetical protein